MNEQSFSEDLPRTSLLYRLFDAVEALAMVPILVVLYPLALVSKWPRFDLQWVVFKSLLVLGQLTPAVKMLMYLSSRQHDRAITSLEAMIGYIEDQSHDARTRYRRAALLWLYSKLVMAHVHSANFEDASVAVIQGCQVLQVDHLPGFGDLDHRSAQVIKAALAAARMLKDGAATATLLVKQNRGQMSGQTEGDRPLQPKNKIVSSAREELTKIDGAKIIPFPKFPDPTL